MGEKRGRKMGLKFFAKKMTKRVNIIEPDGGHGWVRGVGRKILGHRVYGGGGFRGGKF